MFHGKERNLSPGTRSGATSRNNSYTLSLGQKCEGGRYDLEGVADKVWTLKAKILTLKDEIWTLKVLERSFLNINTARRKNLVNSHGSPIVKELDLNKTCGFHLFRRTRGLHCDSEGRRGMQVTGGAVLQEGRRVLEHQCFRCCTNGVGHRRGGKNSRPCGFALRVCNRSEPPERPQTGNPKSPFLSPKGSSLRGSLQSQSSLNSLESRISRIVLVFSRISRISNIFLRSTISRARVWKRELEMVFFGLEAQQRYFSYRAILVATVSQNF